MRPLFQLHLGLSNECNMNCIHCYSRVVEDNRPTTKNSISRRDWKRILKDAFNLGCFKINLVYGEPLLFSSIYDFLEDAYALDFDVEVGTNGTTITPQVAKNLWDIGVRKIHVSIDFPDSRHDKFRRFSGAFLQAVEGIKILRNYSFRIKIATTQLSQDVNFYNAFIKLMDDLKVDTLYFLPERHCRKSVMVERQQKSLKILDTFILNNCDHKIICHDPTRHKLYNSESYEGCFVGNIIHVAPDGEARMCPLWNEQVGNVFKENLGDVWGKINHYLDNNLTRNNVCKATTYTGKVK